MYWKAADKENPPDVNICDYGWYIQEVTDIHGKLIQIPHPFVAKVAPAPPGLMDVVSCTCSSDEPCSTRACSCQRVGISCTYYCKCRCGEVCKNQRNHKADNVEDDVDDDVEDGLSLLFDGNLEPQAVDKNSDEEDMDIDESE